MKTADKKSKVENMKTKSKKKRTGLRAGNTLNPMQTSKVKSSKCDRSSRWANPQGKNKVHCVLRVGTALSSPGTSESILSISGKSRISALVEGITGTASNRTRSLGVLSDTSPSYCELRLIGPTWQWQVAGLLSAAQRLPASAHQHPYS